MVNVSKIDLSGLDDIVKTVNETTLVLRTQVAIIIERYDNINSKVESITNDIKNLTDIVNKIDKEMLVQSTNNSSSMDVKVSLPAILKTYLPWIIASIGILGFGGERLYKAPSPDQQAVLEHMIEKLNQK